MELLDHAEGLMKPFRAVLCDIWGVLHNGVQLFPGAVEALTAYRKSGGRVILVSNAPRPASTVQTQLEQMGTPDDCWDRIVTSGDAMRALILRHPGAKVFHLGPDRDRPLVEGLDIRLSSLAEADYVLCTGLFDDETETPDAYEGMFAKMLEHKSTMYCANPDRVVHRGDRLVYCAGALADRYREMGGRTVLAGKPHAPIYRLAFEKIEELDGKAATQGSVLAIGDSVATDMAGAASAGLPALFVVGGIHGGDLSLSGESLDERALDAFLEAMFRELPGLDLRGVQTRLTA